MSRLSVSLAFLFCLFFEFPAMAGITYIEGDGGFVDVSGSETVVVSNLNASKYVEIRGTGQADRLTLKVSGGASGSRVVVKMGGKNDSVTAISVGSKTVIEIDGDDVEDPLTQKGSDNTLVVLLFTWSEIFVRTDKLDPPFSPFVIPLSLGGSVEELQE